VKAGIDPVHYLGPLGAPGLTGYAGTLESAKPKRARHRRLRNDGRGGMVASQLASDWA